MKSRKHLWMVHLKVNHDVVLGKSFPIMIKSDSLEVAKECAKSYLEEHKHCQRYEVESIEKLEYLGEFKPTRVMIKYIKSIFRKHKYELVKVDANTGKDYKCYECGNELHGVHVKMNAKGLRGCKGKPVK